MFNISFLIGFVLETIYSALISLSKVSLIAVFSFKNVLALTFPWPIFSPLWLYQDPAFSITPNF